MVPPLQVSGPFRFPVQYAEAWGRRHPRSGSGVGFGSAAVAGANTNAKAATTAANIADNGLSLVALMCALLSSNFQLQSERMAANVVATK